MIDPDSRYGGVKAHARSPRAQARFSVALVVVLLVPRLIRFFSPSIWVEDDFYLESARLIAVGMRPYLDFVHPYLPLLEWIAGAYIRIVGASISSLEILNASAIFATSLLTFAVARRALDRPAAAAAAILHAFSSLVFHYHVYERECFAAPLVLVATLVALDGGAAPIREIAWLAITLAAACSVKLTSVIPAAVLLCYVGFVRRDLVRAICAGLGITALLGALSAFCYWRYGFDFIYQVFIFHFLKGRDVNSWISVFPAQVLDVMAPLFLLGVIAIAARRSLGRVLALVLAMVAAECVFFGILSPTAWAHNYLEVLPFIAIVAAIGLMRMWSALRAVVTQKGAPLREWYQLGGGAAVIVLSLAWITLTVNQKWLRGGVFGFGFVPRSEVTQLAQEIARATEPGDEIIAPSFLCFAANRTELIRFLETYGVAREGEAELARYGFWRARDHLGRANFYQLIAETANHWAGPIQRAIGDRKVKVVVNDSPIQLLPIVHVPDEMLTANGYRLALETEHYAVWESGDVSPEPPP